MSSVPITAEWRMTVPNDCSAEQRHIHQPIPFGWYAVAYSADLAAGAVQALRYFSRDLVLFRTEQGEAKVLDAYCPHLGAHLGYGGKVHGDSIACPFHGWQFDGAGHCTKVPYAQNMPPKVANGKTAIRSYPVVERNQQIWAWYHPQDAAPSWQVEAIAETTDPQWSAQIGRAHV